MVEVSSMPKKDNSCLERDEPVLALALAPSLLRVPLLMVPLCLLRPSHQSLRSTPGKRSITDCPMNRRGPRGRFSAQCLSGALAAATAMSVIKSCVILTSPPDRAGDHEDAAAAHFMQTCAPVSWSARRGPVGITDAVDTELAPPHRLQCRNKVISFLSSQPLGRLYTSGHVVSLKPGVFTRTLKRC
ncbi:hypothetical protein Vafri_5980 [Volvox africanus]|nr:hypothetical protein Vafri_5980 [Volvox africanus]